MSAASFATSVADSTEMPTSAACRATASFTPSPRNATSAPRAARDLDDAATSDPGPTRAKTVVCRDRRGERVVVEPVDLGAAQHARHRRAPMSRQTLRRDGAVVAGDDLDRDAEAGELGDRRAGIGLRPIDEREEAHEVRPCSSCRASARRARARRAWRPRRRGRRRRTGASEHARAPRPARRRTARAPPRARPS